MAEKPLPKWNEEEVILALSLFVEGGGKQYSKNSKEIIELSELLRSEYFCPNGLPNSKYRNPDGVAMQVNGFSGLDDTEREGTKATPLFRDAWNKYGFNEHGINSNAASRSIKKLKEDKATILNRIQSSTQSYRNTWIFQWNPKKWRGEQFLEELNPRYSSDWSVNQYHSEISDGDRMLFWKSGPEAGIYAIGTIHGEVFIRAKDNQVDPEKDFERAVTFEIDKRIDPPILREHLKEDPDLGNLSIIKQPVGTQFKVSQKELGLLESFIESTGLTLQPIKNTSWVYREGSGKWTITEEGIYKAIDEFREKGRETFLTEYGFGESTTYKLLFDGELFDPKAIVGVAHKWSERTSSSLTHKQLSGGKDRGHANWCLSELGFQIVEIKTVTKSAGRAREIQVEKNKAEEFLISGRKEGRGERNEARLQEEYKKYLESFGHETCSWELSSENRTSYVDLFDKTTNELCEAKSSAEHAYVWKAIGQVLYYAHLLKREITVNTVSVLLPSLPEKELLELMHKLGIVCVYKTNDSFERIEPG